MITDIHARVADIEARFGRRPAPTAPTSSGIDPSIAFQQMLAHHGTTAPATGTLGQMWSSAAGIAPALAAGARVPANGATPEAAARFQPAFVAAGSRYGIDPELLTAVAWTESNFEPDAVSHAGAIGLMQIMPATAAALGVDPRDPVQAIDGAARYLREQLDRFGDVRLALAAYNAGPGAVQRHGGIPPYEETTAYVGKVLSRYDQVRTV